MELDPQGDVKSPQAAPGAPMPIGGTVTILFSDIRGFTDYTEQYGDEAAYRILQEHNAIVRKQIEAFGGAVVKTQGDSFMVAFPTARGAILCAVMTQRAIAGANQNQSGPRIAVGIGVNTGEPIQEAGDYFGSTVNLAARICAAAGPGQVLIAETTRDVAGRIESIDYMDRGLHELKGFTEAKRLSEVIWRSPTGAAPAGGEAAPAGEAEDIAALTAAVQRALAVLNRVLAVTHLDDPTFRPLLECQAKASELRLTFSRALSEHQGYRVKQVQEAILPFAHLVALVTERDSLKEDRWTALEADVTRAFGRQIVTAVARGRLAGGPAGRPGHGHEATKPEASIGPRASAARPLPPSDPRAEGVRWWAGAYAVWYQWKLSGVDWAHALRAELAKYPYLLSVPLRESAEYDEGRLAGGYFLLLEHVENESPTFMRTVLERAIAATGGSVHPDALGPNLYRLLVNDGRLRETYVAMVRDIVGIAIPNPGVWADGGVVEHEHETLVITRPTRALGDTQERVARLTDADERNADHAFTLAVPPLTTRFFYVKQGELKTLRDVELKLTAGGRPSDEAWYVFLKTSLLVRSEPRRLPPEGVSLPDLGREQTGAWVGIFNPDPDATVDYELMVGVRKPRPKAVGWSPFASRKPRPR